MLSAKILKFIEIEKEKKIKARSQFDCGEKSLNDFIHTIAKSSSKRDVGQTHAGQALKFEQN